MQLPALEPSKLCPLQWSEPRIGIETVLAGSNQSGKLFFMFSPMTFCTHGCTRKKYSIAACPENKSMMCNKMRGDVNCLLARLAGVPGAICTGVCTLRLQRRSAGSPREQLCTWSCQCGRRVSEADARERGVRQLTKMLSLSRHRGGHVFVQVFLRVCLSR